jgi:ubiquinone/menaquinone biosynthesis C-methylase UbiE
LKINRNITLAVHFILDQLVPPIIRDRKLFMTVIMRLSLGKGSKWMMGFKEKFPDMSPTEIEEYYRQSASAHIERETDLNSKCIDRIKSAIVGDTVLDIACGRGYLAKQLSDKYKVTGADFIVDEHMVSESPHIKWDTANIAALNYQDDQFDTVVCTHTLEHVINIDDALAELRRVAKKRLIIVLPRQRPYQYTFDLHVHFFYYDWQVKSLLSKDSKSSQSNLELLGGDWFIYEDQTETTKKHK